MITYVLVMALSTGAGGMSTEKMAFVGKDETMIKQKCEDAGKQFMLIKDNPKSMSSTLYPTYKCLRIAHE
ncbi:hypothetical protein CPT_Metamorpho_271 [Klebsiella phage Metamorpho]|nr:hypothetical protein CPT_Metamorpho_271 [Klebsiella phage Metamorpho]